MKNGSRLAALGGVFVAGALALSACGSDDNTGGSSAANAPGDVNCVRGTVNAAGSSAQKNAIEEWKKLYAQACAGATLNYNPTGSGAGIQAFTAGQVAFAGSDSTMDEQEAAQARQRCQGNPAWHLPMVVGPVAVIYNLPGVDGLQLKPATLAAIFAGEITKWNDPKIAADNPDANLPNTDIKPIHRADESGTTENFTEYLHSVARDEWKWEPAKKWPTEAGGQGATKSDGVVTVLKQTQGGISYVEMSYATKNDLQTAKIANGSGEFVEVSEQSVGNALDTAKQVGQGNDLALELDYNTKSGYPIFLVTYEIVCSKGLPAEQAEFVKAFLTYTAGEDGQKVLSDVGYAPLSPALAGKVRAAVEALS
ncbi:phosphate ABC transporter substrate-binding protein PstS [Thermomonospora catenispora]|uniref:phosphate ABC transporter substrate-binding protein PstS n=1 Tax=Thermomonospora catenispora TaxID=2493090 RepID=UPI00111FB30F|nr:phosphate ABC transporter substrate-binding protein PstS [Thermomonospora catenispora]TNY36639.1 phosphate ABC transporter substrate-binding protein PstS [Thermomonospora catenispora]